MPTYLKDLAEAHVKLGVLADEENNYAQASAEYRKAQEILQQAASSLAASPDFLVELGGNLCNIGNSLRADQRPADALKSYGQAIETLEAVLAKEPQVPFAQKFLANAYAARALALLELDRVAESLHDADRALQLVEPANRAFFVTVRARCLARQSTERQRPKSSNCCNKLVTVPRCTTRPASTRSYLTERRTQRRAALMLPEPWNYSGKPSRVDIFRTPPNWRTSTKIPTWIRSATERTFAS